MNRLPAWAWNLLALFCAALIPVVAMAENSDVIAIPILRLSVAVLGCAAVAAGSRGHFLHAVRNAGKHIQKNLHRLLPWAIFLTVVASIIVFFVVAFFQGLKRFYLITDLRSAVQQNGMGLLQYAADYDETLPPNITAQTVEGYLKDYLRPRQSISSPFSSLIDPISEKPFIWRHSLSGANIKKIKHPEKVIVAYSLPYDNRGQGDEYRAILFLDGHSLLRNDKQFWELMNEQRKLLQKK